MSARSKARKRALDVLFQADLAGQDPISVFEATQQRFDGPMNPYTEVLVRGVVSHQADIDAAIETNSNEWSLERMPTVDRNVLRIGAFELIYQREQIPAGVAISEAVALASDLSTDDSGGFVNGVLGQIARADAANQPNQEVQVPSEEPTV